MLLMDPAFCANSANSGLGYHYSLCLASVLEKCRGTGTGVCVLWPPVGGGDPQRGLTQASHVQ